MTTPTISEFLCHPDTEITSIYGHLVSAFQTEHDLSSSNLIYCSFRNALAQRQLSFRFNTETLEVSDLVYKHIDTSLVPLMTETDLNLITTVLPIYFDRVAQYVRKLNREMRADWGRQYKVEVLERSGYTHYMSNASTDIERSHKLNIFNYTMASATKKRAMPYMSR